LEVKDRAAAMIASTTRSELVQYFRTFDFPATKDELLTFAARAGCKDDTCDALGRLAPGTYTNGDQVLASVSVVDDGDITGDGAETAGSRRARGEPECDCF